MIHLNATKSLRKILILFKKNGFEEYKKLQNSREELLKEMLSNYNEGRSKSYYCIAATVIKIEELKQALSKAKEASYGLDLKNKSKVLHSILDEIAKQGGYYLGLRKKR
jgi:hypothetical protein